MPPVNRTQLLEEFQDLVGTITDSWPTLFTGSPASKKFAKDVKNRIKELRTMLKPPTIMPCQRTRTRSTRLKKTPAVPSPDSTQRTQENHPNQETDASEPTASSGPLDAIASKTKARVGSILTSAFTLGVVRDKEFLSFVGRADKEGREASEDSAFIRLVRGLDEECDWHAAVNIMTQDWSSEDPPQYMKFLHQDLLHDSPCKRLVEMHITLSALDHSEAKKRLEYHISRTLAELDFAFGYERFTSGPGGRAYQKLFHYALFFETSPGLFHARAEGITPAEIEQEIAGHLQEEYTTWKKKIAVLLNGRNRLKRVYLALGPGVFLDPFWDIQHMDNDSRTKSFISIIDTLSEAAHDFTQPSAPPYPVQSPTSTFRLPK
ncbi:hypothetical protein VNI00_004017 [Paramarasmius palmivorus]|uniref:Uncharacterized protein n=1 Tax=Paramarasmius palmivorus TaxID=297713 RepID=A0AAW0DMS5_9AGAR